MSDIKETIKGNELSVIASNGSEIDIKVSGKDKKADSALLTQIEDLLDTLLAGSEPKKATLTKAKDLSDLLEENPSEFAAKLKEIMSGKTTDSQQKEALEAFTKFVGKKEENIGKGIMVLAKAVDGSKEQKDAQESLGKATDMLGKVSDAVDNGETSLEEILKTPEMQEFLKGLSDSDYEDLSKKVRDALASVLKGNPGDADFINEVMDVIKNAAVYGTSDTDSVIKELTDPKQLKALYELPAGQRKAKLSAMAAKAQADGPNKCSNATAAMIKLALGLQDILSCLYEAQSGTSAQMTEIMDALSTALGKAAKSEYNKMSDEMNKQQTASAKPWWTYLISAVLIAVGAVITIATAGAGGVVAAGIGVLIGVIMATPVGDMITTGLAKAIGGGTSSTGSQIAASAIVAVISTILTLGAGGFTAGAEIATEEGVDAATTDAAEALGKAGSKVAGAAGSIGSTVARESEQIASQSMSVEMTQFTEGTTAAGKKFAQAAEDAEGAVANADGGGSSSNSSFKLKASKFFSSVKSIRPDGTAFIKGLETRAVGTLIQQLLGSGILLEGVEGLMEMTEDGKADLQKGWVIGLLAAAGIAVSIAGSIGAGKLSGIGIKARGEYLEEAKVEDPCFSLTGVAKVVTFGIQTAALLAQAGVDLMNYFQLSAVSSAQKEVGEAKATLMEVDLEQKDAQTMQSQGLSRNKNTIKNATEALGMVISSFGVEDQNVVSALTS